MTAIFYYIGFLIFMLYIPMLISYVSTTRLHYSYKILSGNKNTEIINEYDRPTYFRFLQSGLTVFVSWSWLVIGLLSSNWFIFLFIIISYTILNRTFSIIGSKKKINYIRVFLYMLLYLALALSSLFISVNHFFLKYDLTFELKSILGIL